ncbi:MAG: hypothetical protein ACQEQ4_09990 [Fibrobacterota bacterium]
MNKFILILAALPILFSCTDDFGYRYDEIRDDMIRIIDFSLEDPDLAPGDTAVLYAVFAGQEIALDDMTWQVSWNVVYNKFGNINVRDTMFLPWLTLEEIDSLADAQVFRLTYKIPDSIVYDTEQHPEDFSVFLRENNIPVDLSEIGFPTQTSELIDLLEGLSRDPDRIEDLPVENPGWFIEALSQMLATPYRIILTLPGDAVVEEGYPRRYAGYARYHSRFRDVPHVFTNDTPGMQRVYVGGIEDPSFPLSAADIDTVIALQQDSVCIPDQERYSWFLMVHTTPREETVSLRSALQALGGEDYSLSRERHRLHLFREYGVNNPELNSVPVENNDDTLFAYEIEPFADDFTGFFLWLNLYDYFDDIPFRHHGSSVREVYLGRD